MSPNIPNTFAPLDFDLDTSLIPSFTDPLILAQSLRLPPTHYGDSPPSHPPTAYPHSSSFSSTKRRTLPIATIPTNSLGSLTLIQAKAHLKAQAQKKARREIQSHPQITPRPIPRPLVYMINQEPQHAKRQSKDDTYKSSSHLVEINFNQQTKGGECLTIPKRRILDRQQEQRAIITESQLRLPVFNPDSDSKGANDDDNIELLSQEQIRTFSNPIDNKDKSLPSIPQAGETVPSPRLRSSRLKHDQIKEPLSTSQESRSSACSKSTRDWTSPPKAFSRSHFRSTSFDRASTVGLGIRLGPAKDPIIVELLRQLHSLSPAHRLAIVSSSSTQPSPFTLDPSTGILYPSAFLTPLSIILEALVTERLVLRHYTMTDTTTATITIPTSIPQLELLPDHSSLQLSHGQGELDWSVIAMYTRRVGDTIRAFLPYLSRFERRDEVEVLMRSVRAHVLKIKKVFEQIIELYGDDYAFLRGWWDDRGFKVVAKEIGQWSDLFDV